MWLLRNDSKGLVYRVTPAKQHVVTRKDGDMILLGDQSISRKHAILQIGETEDDGIIVNDLGSKYGTFTKVGDGEIIKLTPNQSVTLHNGDSVKFGIQWNCWRAEFVRLLVTHSTLNQEDKSELKQMVGSLGGNVVNNWTVECSHLTMNKLTVTIKVVCALAAAQPIVTPLYWRNLSQSLQTMETTLPDCKDFLPPLAEDMLNPSEVSFTPNPARRLLFQGCTFVAASKKQLDRIRPMITAAGGKVVEFSSKIWTEDKLLEEKTVLMLSASSDRQGSQQSQVFDGYIPMARKLKSKGVRCVLESEIGLSVLYCSMSEYCNPRCTNQALMKSSCSGEATQRVNVICPNTEESMETDEDNKGTEPGPTVQPKSVKRPLQDHNVEQEPLSKRPDLRRNSEDFFGSRHVNPSNSSIETMTSVKKTVVSNKPQQKQVKTNPVPSLDMFAPSGEKSGPSNVHNQSVEIPSYGDMFASTGSRKQDSKTLPNDEFSFPRTKNVNEPVVNLNNGDEFSFMTTKNSVINKKESENIAGQNSHKSGKPSSDVKLRSELKDDDEFSFITANRPNKRNRQSNPDMFQSSAESSIVIDEPVPGPSKILDNFSFRSSKQNVHEDNLFAFPDDNNPKRQRVDGEVLDLNKTESEVKLALLSNKCRTDSVSNCLQDLEVPPEPENLITYSKANKMPTKIKQECESVEIDELAKDLLNATIVIVKPLVVSKEKPSKGPAATCSGKNFKKFQKVVGINKRMIPHIIGGSDLVSHFNFDQHLNKDTSPIRVDATDYHDDEWAFDKKKTNRRTR